MLLCIVTIKFASMPNYHREVPLQKLQNPFYVLLILPLFLSSLSIFLIRSTSSSIRLPHLLSSSLIQLSLLSVRLCHHHLCCLRHPSIFATIFPIIFSIPSCQSTKKMHLASNMVRKLPVHQYPICTVVRQNTASVAPTKLTAN